MENDKICKAVSGWVPALLIGVGIVLLGLFIKQGFTSISNNQRVVSVRGLCEKEVMANKVTWPIVSKLTGDDLPSIYQQTETTNSAIVAFLKQNGLTDKEISVNPPQVVDMQADRYNNNPSPFPNLSSSLIFLFSSFTGNLSHPVI